MNTLEILEEVHTLIVAEGGPQGPRGPRGLPGSSSSGSVATKTTDYTITDEDDVILADATAGAIVITLPEADTLTGKKFSFKKIDASANTVTLSPTGESTVDGSETAVIHLQNVSLTLACDGTHWRII